MSKGIFEDLIARDGAKKVLRAALRDGRVDLLLTGPPASGKSVVLTALEEAADHAYYVDASGVTKAKLRDILAQDYDVLLLDEIDDMRSDAYTALTQALEQRRVTKAVQGNEIDVEISTQILAASNDVASIPDHIDSRFIQVKFPEYTRDELLDVCSTLMPRAVDWIESEGAAEAAAAAAVHELETSDVRTVRDVLRLAGGQHAVEDIAKSIQDADADVSSDALSPDEIGQASNTAKGDQALVESMSQRVEEMSDKELLDLVDHCRQVLAEVETRDLDEDGRPGEDDDDEQAQVEADNLEILWETYFLENMDNPEDPITGEEQPITHVEDALVIHFSEEFGTEMHELYADIYNSTVDNTAFFPDPSHLDGVGAQKAFDLKKKEGAFTHRRFDPTELIAKLNEMAGEKDGKIIVSTKVEPLM